MRVLVIGGTRYLGRAIVQRLAARGDEVTVANRGQTASDLPLGVAQVICDIDEHGSLLGALEGLNFDAAVHMIAMNGPRALTVLEDLRGRIDHYVQCGSTGVYMPLQVVPADEDHPVDPPSDKRGGFNGKAEAYRQAAELCAEWDLPMTSVNPTCIIGAGAVPIDLWGARDPKFFQRVADGKRITIPNDGRGLVQLGNVQDIADCFVLALDRPDKPGVYNASSRYAITHNYYVELLAEVLGVTVKVRHMSVAKIIKRWPDKVNVRGIRFFAEHMCFTMRKAERELGYESKFTPEMSVDENVRWMLDEGIVT
jgi:nucleoside-diphosphate-sugar epimerase